MAEDELLEESQHSGLSGITGRYGTGVDARDAKANCSTKSHAFRHSVTPANSTEVDESEEGFIFTQSQVASLKADVSHSSKENFELERHVRQFDTRIGLLVNLRIAYDKEQVDRLDFGKLAVLGRGQHAERSPTWPSELQLKHYGTLFFLLQTKPHYLAKLARQVGTRHIDDLLKVIMFTLYGHHYDPREEHLLLCMFEHALTQEFEQAADSTCVLRQNTAITRMMTSFTRRGPGQEYLHQVLTAPVVFLTGLGDNLEVDPVLVYAELVEKGQRSADTPPGFVAGQDESVKEIVEIRSKRLEEVLETLLGSIFRSVNNVPFGIRWLCKTIRSLVYRFFPDSSHDQQGKGMGDRAASLVGGFFFLRYINPTIVSPSKINIKGESTKSANRTLTLVAKIIQKIANQGDPTQLREDYMAPFVEFIGTYQRLLKDFLEKLCDVDEFHDFMQVEHFLAFTKNDVKIDVEMSDIHKLHTLLNKHQEKVVPTSDQLRNILNDLGEPPFAVMNPTSKATLHLCSRVTMGDEIEKMKEDCSFAANELMGHNDAFPLVGQQLRSYEARCINVLGRLFRIVPETFRSWPLMSVFEYCKNTSTAQIRDMCSVGEILVTTLRRKGVDIEENAAYKEMKVSLPRQDEIHAKCRAELMHLIRIQKLVNEHRYFLLEQLEAYKVYLTAARNKAVTSRLHVANHARRSPSRSPTRRRLLHQQQVQQPVRVAVPALRRDNVVVACPAHRNRQSVEVASPSPGQYVFSVVRRERRASGDSSDDADVESSSPALEIQLETLLELRLDSSPVFLLDGNITFDANATIHWLQRNVR